MAHKKALKALDRTLQDLRDNTQPFGIFSTNTACPRSTPADELNECLKMYHSWRHMRKLQLRTNMHVQLVNDASAVRFSKQLLNMGNGKIPIDETTNCITLLPDFCKLPQSIEELISNVFPNIQRNYMNHRWLCEREILAAKNNDVNAINAAYGQSNQMKFHHIQID